VFDGSELSYYENEKVIYTTAFAPPNALPMNSADILFYPEITAWSKKVEAFNRNIALFLQM